MTIRNIFYTVAYGLWIYILLCLMIKLLLDSVRRTVFTRRMKYIRRYFRPGGARKEKSNRKEKRMLRYGRNLILLTCACRSYYKGLPQYSREEKAKLESLIGNMIRAASQVSGRTAEERCAVAAMARYCGVPAQAGEWPEASAMEAFWAEQKECEQP